MQPNIPLLKQLVAFLKTLPAKAFCKHTTISTTGLTCCPIGYGLKFAGIQPNGHIYPAKGKNDHVIFSELYGIPTAKIWAYNDFNPQGHLAAITYLESIVESQEHNVA